jgi:malonyl-CoA decarboxylase
VQALLDEHAPVFDNRKADTAIFYSINTQVGLRGVSFGNFLLKRVIDDLQRDFPSWPISPPCRRCPAWRPGCARTRPCWATGIELSLEELSTGAWAADKKQARALREPCPASLHVTWPAPSRAVGRAGRRPTRCRASTSATARASSGSTTGRQFGQGFPPVLRADGQYLYSPDDIEANLEAFASQGSIAMSATVRRLARKV